MTINTKNIPILIADTWVIIEPQADNNYSFRWPDGKISSLTLDEVKGSSLRSTLL
jgi:hypothetical protein